MPSKLSHQLYILTILIIDRTIIANIAKNEITDPAILPLAPLLDKYPIVYNNLEHEYTNPATVVAIG